MTQPKRQHIIPQCYLRQFVDANTPADQDPYVWVFERGTKKGKRRAPKNIFTETDFYTLKVKDGGKDYAIEKTLSQVESEYSLVFERKIKQHLPLDDYEHVVLCAFVAAMLQRTAKQKKNIEGFMEQVIEQLESIERAHGMPLKASVEWRREQQDAHKISLMQAIQEITPILAKMNLAFLCADRSVSFITSDAPCFFFNSQLQWQQFYGPGLGQRYVEVRLPLSPDVSVCFSWANNLRGYLGINQDLVHECNRMVFGHADAYFIANSPELKRRWFRRFPLDPVFVARILINKAKGKLERLSRKRYV